jgi:hypothetical protein
MVRNFFQIVKVNTAPAMRVLDRAEAFWEERIESDDAFDLMRFTLLMGILPFSGYLFSYTITGKVWSVWPFIQSTLPVTRGLMCAGLQWVFFAVFPILSSLLLEALLGRLKLFPDARSCSVICTFSMTPLFLAALFVGAPFFGRIFAVLGMATFLYLLYFGYRIYLKQSILRSGAMAFAVGALFALIRQMFVFVIGF